MFTGIVTQRASVAEILQAPAAEAGSKRLVLALERPLVGLALGDSVAVDGVCLTVDGQEGARISFTVVPETLRRTTLGRRKPGDKVNVEAALRMGDPLGGHLVQGHVDGVGKVRAVEKVGGDVRLRIDLPSALRGATLSKGSIAVDGVSLTVGESEEGSFSVYLVPHTLAVTGLSAKGPGDEVNVEGDLVGRYVEHHVRRWLEASGRPSLPVFPSESPR